MDSIVVIFAFGSVVFMITIAAAFCALIASDDPAGEESPLGNQTSRDSAQQRGGSSGQIGDAREVKPVDAIAK